MKIIRDTREKQPLQFGAGHKIIVQKMDTGDYTLLGYEDVLCIERKKSPSECALNIFKKHFWNSMERLSKFKYSYFICEFSEDELLQYPKNAKIPWKLKRRIRVKGPLIHKKLSSLEENNIKVIYAGSRKQTTQVIKLIFQEVQNELSDKK